MEEKHKLKFHIQLIIKNMQWIKLLLIILNFIYFQSCKDRVIIESEYYDNGKIKSEITYKDSLKYGKAKFYYLNGTLKEEYIFIHDTIQGDYISYDEDGLVSAKGYFINGKAIGPTYYYKKGKLVLYNERDFGGGVYYVKKYDTLTHILIKEEGVCVCTDSTAYKSLNIDNEKYFLFFYSQPTNCLNELKSFIDGVSIKYDTLKGHIGIIKVDNFKDKGRTLKVYSSLKSTENSIVICYDSLINIIH